MSSIPGRSRGDNFFPARGWRVPTGRPRPSGNSRPTERCPPGSGSRAPPWGSCGARPERPSLAGAAAGEGRGGEAGRGRRSCRGQGRCPGAMEGQGGSLPPVRGCVATLRAPAAASPLPAGPPGTPPASRPRLAARSPRSARARSGSGSGWAQRARAAPPGRPGAGGAAAPCAAGRRRPGLRERQRSCSAVSPERGRQRGAWQRDPRHHGTPSWGALGHSWATCCETPWSRPVLWVCLVPPLPRGCGRWQQQFEPRSWLRAGSAAGLVPPWASCFNLARIKWK